MNFRELLIYAKSGDQIAFQCLLDMYKPLLLNESSEDGVLDKDLYQELCLTLFDCVRRFKV